MKYQYLIPTLIIFYLVGISSHLHAQQDTATYLTDQHDLHKDIDPERDINQSVPQRDYLLLSLVPKAYSKFKEDLYDKTGIKFGLSYQTLYQKANNSNTEKNTAWGGWFLFEFSWIAFNKDQDYQGKLIFSLDDRHIINSDVNQSPTFFRLDIGSLWATDAAFLKWNLYPATLFWEQTFVKDRLELRIGQFGSLTMLDFFRFADPRTSFSGTQLAAPVALIPIGPPGLSMSVKWWPIKDSELYVVGLVSDANARIGTIDWSGIFEYGEVFTGAEVGYNVIRRRGDFDHAHLTLWYGDQISSRPFPTKAGWGFKVHGSKQWQKLVVYGNYAYNTSQGGGFNYTNTQNAFNLGAAYVKPFDITGELALAGSWAQPIDGQLRNQTGFETYWKILLGSDFWVTPGAQFIWNPTFNLSTDFISIPQNKARVYF